MNIAAHRLLGDGGSTALLQPDGCIDWWCAPTLDDPPLLWSLLDPDGGEARWLGVRMASADGPPAGPTARTVVHQVGRGRIELWDGLVCAGEKTIALVRLARGLDDDLVLEHRLALGGFDQPRATWRVEAGVALATVGALPITVYDGDGCLEHRVATPEVLATTATAQRGSWVGLVVSLAPGTPVAMADLLAHLEEAEADQATWLGGAALPAAGPAADRASDALAVLRACTYGPTGAVIASPTTSLPEVPGADRQFDYRYTWLRDASLAVSVAVLLGRRDLSSRYLRFVVEQASEARVPSGPMTDVRGGTVPAEREIPGIEGWAGSRPVRVGNAAADQVQYDALGFLVEAVAVHLEVGGRLDHDTWHLVQTIADRAAAADGEATSGIWELREPRLLVSADIGRWLALDRAITIARLRRPWTRRAAWIVARDEARHRVLGALQDDGGLPQAYSGPGSDTADASALMAVVFGLVARTDRRASRLIDATLDRLGAWPFIYRYEPGGDDGFAGSEGAFVPCSWWAISALARVGRVAEADERLRALDRAVPRLQPEEVHPETLAALGNTPLVWSHMEAARALYLLEVARVRRRWGAAGVVVWRLDRLRRIRAGGPS